MTPLAGYNSRGAGVGEIHPMTNAQCLMPNEKCRGGSDRRNLLTLNLELFISVLGQGHTVRRDNACGGCQGADGHPWLEVHTGPRLGAAGGHVVAGPASGLEAL